MPRRVLPGKPRRAGRNRERQNRQATRTSIAVAERHLGLQRHFDNLYLGKGLRKWEDAGVVLQNAPYGPGGVELKLAGFPQQHDTQGVVQLGVGGHDSLHRDMAGANRDWPGQAVELLAHIG